MDKYSLIISNFIKTYNILDIDKNDLDEVVNAYKIGKKYFALNGTRFSLEKCSYFRVYKNPEKVDFDKFLKAAYEAVKAHRAVTERWVGGSAIWGLYLKDQFFVENHATNLTREFIANIGYGDLEEERRPVAMAVAETVPVSYVDDSIIEEIRKLPTDKFDFSKLVVLLEELNDNYSRDNYHSIAYLLRAIIDHVPPLFQKKNFNEVVNQCFSGSDKKLVLRLQDDFRNVSDREIHSHINKKVILVTEPEIELKQNVAALLKEIIRLHH